MSQGVNMGITREAAEIIMHCNSEKPITGEFCCIGKQSVTMNKNEIEKIFQYYFECEQYQIEWDHDHLTRNPLAADSEMTDKSFIKSIFLSDKRNRISYINYNCIDVSDYEGANIIHDMNKPVKRELYSKFDFIYDGSCIDNVFDPACFLINISKMLKINGRAIIFTHSSLYPGAFVMINPEWLFSYFAVNNYKYCRVIVSSTKYENSWLNSKTDFFEYSPSFTRNPNYNRFTASQSDSILLSFAIAQKGDESTDTEKPIQLHYANNDQNDLIFGMYELWKKNYTKIKSFEIKNPTPRLPLDSDHFTYVGSTSNLAQ
jgi:SAM-dependent methyltransferase